ncbi:PDR/VanB family oxidoreductase [Variovorax sp. J31P207]|uniref:PDR/VanB family oxidoreductase n=1 Tax=Variovorax sp. J31P207 TaxID=3053510 RepID=UPI002578CFF1|nr:PDR/VanB family oxidoreductase [Variovorax sp. J31P207]MDM0066832.1 PDR/VanB family oxidoreductase [Variovorax sp. J31P207]
MASQAFTADALARDDRATHLPLQLRVAQRRCEAVGVVAFDLVDPDGAPLPPFEAGAHLLVETAPGIVRAYSVCNSPTETERYTIAVLREPDSRGGSSALHERVKPGNLLRTSAPRNEFPLQIRAKRSLLLAGGIGITPLLAMAERLCETDGDFVLHYCTREAARTAFSSRLAESRFAGRVHIHHDDGNAAQRFEAAQVLASPSEHTHIYVCGPGGFIEHVLSTAKALGWAPEQLHREFFAPPVKAVDAAEKDAAFDLILSSSGQRVHVPAGCSAASALQAAGVPLVVSCEQGVCGTCVTTVLEGEPEHRDCYLTDDDRRRNDCFTPCCSRARSSELRIDL